VVTQLLARIGLSREDVRPDLKGLRAVHRAYVGSIPYEDISVQLGETGALDPLELVERLLVDGRGGYCFELNTVLGWLLEELGFSLTHHQAVVGGEGPTNHMALVVSLDDGWWIADAGLGEGFVDPIPLRDGSVDVGPFTWTVENDPESPFVKTLVVQKPGVDRIDTLRARTYSVVGPGAKVKRVVADEAEFWRVLAGKFGVTRRDPRLWALAVAQHEAFTASRPSGVGAG
jgi:N-hydroxyarylamine O-acetyltransferase